MTVKELIRILQSLPTDAPVVLFDLDDSGRHWYYSPKETVVHMRKMVRAEETCRDELQGDYYEQPAPGDYDGGYKPERISEPMTVVVLAP